MEKYRPVQLNIVMFLILMIIWGESLSETTQERIDIDVLHNKPVIVHVLVALADNKNQWISPVPQAIGNGQKTENNLYWGARYGLKTYLLKDAGWEKVASYKIDNDSILERLVLKTTIERNGKSVLVYLVADAWDGRYIAETIRRFLSFSAGYENIPVKINENEFIMAGGSAHLKVYIGHNALMDYFGLKDKVISTPEMSSKKRASNVAVLACKSQQYFKKRLEVTGSYPLLLTTGLMAPESYTLDAIIKEWVRGGTDRAVRNAAASAYAKHQKISKRSSRLLFGANN